MAIVTSRLVASSLPLAPEEAIAVIPVEETSERKTAQDLCRKPWAVLWSGRLDSHGGLLRSVKWAYRLHEMARGSADLSFGAADAVQHVAKA